MYRRHLKRVFDLCVASIALVAFAPLLLILAALVRGIL
jgi:Bacterial sugar transferase.